MERAQLGASKFFSAPEVLILMALVIVATTLTIFLLKMKSKTEPAPVKVHNPRELIRNRAAITIQRYQRIFSARKTAMKALADKEEFKMLDRVMKS